MKTKEGRIIDGKIMETDLPPFFRRHDFALNDFALNFN